jgi:8-oxo-dGTP pyrophosphatase MutT (NUDIX family)
MKTGVIIQNSHGAILGCHPYGTPADFWDLPKGTVEHDEDCRIAAFRELLEETGITIPADENVSYLGEFEYRHTTIKLYFIRKDIDITPCHCTSLIDNPRTPERNGFPEMDAYKWLYKTDIHTWSRSVQKVLKRVKFPKR